MNRLAALHQQLVKAIGGQGVPMLSIMGGTFTVKDGENQKNVSNQDKNNNNALYVDVHIIDASPYKAKVYYEGKFDPKADPIAPKCYSDDGEKPSDNATEKQSEYCQQCPHNVWGSQITENGSKTKACRDAWKIAVTIPEHGNDSIFMLRIPGGSLKNWLGYIAAFNDYPVDGEDRKMNASDVITRIFFEPNVLNTLAFSAVELATPEARAAANELVEDGKTAAYIGLPNMSEEKRAEALQLSAPTAVKKLAGPKTAPKQIQQEPRVEIDEEGNEVLDGVIEEDEEEEAAPPPPPPVKAKNTLLASEMRTKVAGKAAPVPQPKPNMPKPVVKTATTQAAPSEAKSTLSPNLKSLLGNVMKLSVKA